MPLDADDALVPPPPPDSYEFDATAADVPDPAPSSDAPGTDQESPDQPGAQETAEQADEAPPEFDPRYRQPFVGLLYVGHLEATFRLWGHRFKIATPSRRERIQMGLAVVDFQGTATWELAWQAAVVSGYLLEVDGEPLPEPVLNKAKDTAFQERFEWVLENVRDPVMDELYTKCLELDSQVDKTVAAMGKASG